MKRNNNIEEEQFDEIDVQAAESYEIPNEQESNNEIGGIKLPSNPNTWLFVVIIIGISSIFAILTKLQNDRVEDVQQNLEYWKGLHAKQQKKIDSLYLKLESSEHCIDKIQRLRKAVDEIRKDNTADAKTKKQAIGKLIDDL